MKYEIQFCSRCRPQLRNGFNLYLTCKVTYFMNNFTFITFKEINNISLMPFIVNITITLCHLIWHGCSLSALKLSLPFIPEAIQTRNQMLIHFLYVNTLHKQGVSVEKVIQLDFQYTLIFKGFIKYYFVSHWILRLPISYPVGNLYVRPFRILRLICTSAHFVFRGWFLCLPISYPVVDLYVCPLKIWFAY